MNRVEQINNYAINKANKENEERIAKRQRIEAMKEEIKALRPRLEELFSVGIACEENNIPLITSGDHVTDDYEHHHFISNGITHTVGFVRNYDAFEIAGCEANIKGRTQEWYNQIGGFGKIGGGACDYNLAIILTHNDVKVFAEGGDKERALKMFLEKFDEFETEFYKYVDKITGANNGLD